MQCARNANSNVSFQVDACFEKKIYFRDTPEQDQKAWEQ